MNNIGFQPKFNITTARFSSRDSLGIESVAATISGELCPIITTVTPRAFYWAFMCWIYYDFYKNSRTEDWRTEVFYDTFLKRQDYYFVLANLLANNPDQKNLVGIQKTSVDIAKDQTGPYKFNSNYFSSSYGGMLYYYAGCMTMQFITDHNDDETKPYALPRLTQFGEEMALAFEKVIKDTSYYKQYRLYNTLVPKDVLIEYAKVIQLNMKGFDECKAILRRHLFERNRKLRLCADYAKLVFAVTHTHDLGLNTARRILYDYYSPRGEAHPYPDELKDTIQGWEIVIGRQYFTSGIEMIWKYMLSILNAPYSLDEWTERVLGSVLPAFLEQTVKSVLPECDLDHDERERMVSKARSSGIQADSAADGLKLALSVYNRFRSRDDMGDALSFYDYGRGRIPGTGAISMNEWIMMVDRSLNMTIKGFMTLIMQDCIISQHKRTCYEKITRPSRSVNGFYFEYVNGSYMKNEHEFQVDFQGNRFVQLMQVMYDLDMFKE